MKIAVLGGLGLQGRAAMADLVASSGVEEVICVEPRPEGAARLGGLGGSEPCPFRRPEGPVAPHARRCHEVSTRSSICCHCR